MPVLLVTWTVLAPRPGPADHALNVQRGSSMPGRESRSDDFACVPEPRAGCFAAERQLPVRLSLNPLLEPRKFLGLPRR